MALASLIFEDKLEGSSSFLSWKVEVTLLLEENDLWDIVKHVVTTSTNPLALVVHNKKEVKAKQMIMDARKDHLISRMSKKKTMKDMFDALVFLYQSENINRKMILHNKLKVIEMTRSNLLTNCMMVMNLCKFMINLQELGRRLNTKS